MFKQIGYSIDTASVVYIDQIADAQYGVCLQVCVKERPNTSAHPEREYTDSKT